MTTVDRGVAAGPEDLEHAENDQHPVGHGRMLRKAVERIRAGEAGDSATGNRDRSE